VLLLGLSFSWLLQPTAAANEKQRDMLKTSGPPALYGRQGSKALDSSDFVDSRFSTQLSTQFSTESGHIRSLKLCVGSQ
jgi:hypothetical protein